MAPLNNDEESRGIFGAVCEIALGGLAGVLVCAGWLIFKPVKVADAAPEADRVITDRHETFYVRGQPGNLRSRTWERKERAVLSRASGVVELTEEDINRWVMAKFASVDWSKKNDEYAAEMHPSLPAVNLDGDQLSVGMEINFKVAGLEKNMVVQAHGAFAKKSGGYVFVPTEVRLGSCPLPWALGGRMLYESLLSKFEVPAEVRDAWADVDQLVLAESRLKLAFGAGTITPAAPAPAPAPEATSTTPAPAIPTEPVMAAPAPAPQPVTPEASPTEVPTPAPAVTEPATDATSAVPPETTSAPDAQAVTGEEPIAAPAAPEETAPTATEPAPAEAATPTPASESTTEMAPTPSVSEEVPAPVAETPVADESPPAPVAP